AVIGGILAMPETVVFRSHRHLKRLTQLGCELFQRTSSTTGAIVARRAGPTFSPRESNAGSLHRTDLYRRHLHHRPHADRRRETYPPLPDLESEGLPRVAYRWPSARCGDPLCKTVPRGRHPDLAGRRRVAHQYA